ncbi:hypothetical protein K7X08_016490 [Anisodus acutangulus]|uniref:MAGE domain-containing protein n=1 Tax=Anisodus acutangulus TaxID=402998 RepID=A0A9Q1LFB1_9SOLA|nr:hypothetical protein K7X08_016490 [Anisodus acutangulus]
MAGKKEKGNGKQSPNFNPDPPTIKPLKFTLFSLSPLKVKNIENTSSTNPRIIVKAKKKEMSGSGEDFSQFGISAEEKDKLVAEVIRYVLFKTEQNSGCPIKREELTQLITGRNYRQRNLPAFVINEAKSKLSSIFGFEMRELQRSRSSSTQNPRSSQQVGADAKSYVLISQLPADVYKSCVEDEKKSHVTALKFVVTGIVHLAGGKINEENLWHQLRRLGLSETDESHPVHGNVKLALDAIVQQRYLHKEKVNGPEGNTTFYELAERALDGPINDGMKEHISKIVNKGIASVDAN